MRDGTRRILFTLILLTFVASRLAAQTAAADQPPMLGGSFSAAALADLPSGSNIFSLLDSAIPEVIADRVDAGGLTAGQSALVGARGSSWTQTTFRIGDADITDPSGSGIPMLLPGLHAWERVDVGTGMLPADINAPGMAVSLVPREPSAKWTSVVDFSGAGSALMSRSQLTNPPPIARQNGYSNGSALFSGPVVPGRVGIVVTGGWAKSSLFERAHPLSVDSNVASGLAHLVVTPNTRDEVRIVAWGEHASSPASNRNAFGSPEAAISNSSLHGQVTWQRRLDQGTTWNVFGSATRRATTSDMPAVSRVIIERLEDGPVPRLLEPTGAEAAWSLGTRFRPRTFTMAGRSHATSTGISVLGGRVSSTTPFSGRIGELLDGIPARIWEYTGSPSESHRHETTLAAYASDVIRLSSKLTFETGIRFEAFGGSADGAAQGISWRTWYPRETLRWDMTSLWQLAMFTSFGRYGYRLPLADLAYGDPAAPVGSVYRWTAASLSADPLMQNSSQLISRVGPGTGGNPAFAGIDPDIHRPYLDEFVIGVDASPTPKMRYRLSAIARREKQLIGVVNTGVPDSTYSTVMVTDPINDKYSEGVLTVYNRAPSTFGADRYLLTNPQDHEATYVGLELSAQTVFKRLIFAIGGTAGRSEGLAADVGFTAIENDRGVPGEVFTNPNSRIHAQGRLFTERGYTAKTTGVYQFPHDLRLGVAARYQDGQHFARILTVTDLNQGPEPIRAFRNGRTRFTYTMTLDARLQKGFTISNRRFAVVLDGYNLLNTATEIEEIAVSGPESRNTSATQPPRSFHVGFRFAF